MFTKAKAWFDRWGVVRKGSFSSGNYGHRGLPKTHGGSQAGGGHGSLPGIMPWSGEEEVQQAITDWREGERESRPATRPPTENETRVSAELADAQSYLKTLSEDHPDYQPYLEYTQTTTDWLDHERGINDSLWVQKHKTPDEASLDDWKGVANSLEAQGYSLYKELDIKGISFATDEARGARPDSVVSVIGSREVICKRGAFSLRQAAKIKAEKWADAKPKLSGALGDLLVKAGFTKSQIKRAPTFEQRKRLLSELGAGALSRGSRGSIARIGGIKGMERKRVLRRINADMRQISFDTSVDPLNAPTIGAWKLMATADWIRAVYLPVEGTEGVTALNFSRSRQRTFPGE